MRLLVTADLHYNHVRSKPLARELIEQMNRAGGDVLLLVGDTATANGDALEECLSLFEFDRPKLFVAGNHELWTRGDDSYGLFTTDLPRRVRSLGWTWLETEPFIAGETAIVGTIGWYDYSLAQSDLEIPRRFYEAKISPGAAQLLPEFRHLLADDVSDRARSVVARWNDGKFVKLHKTDEAFLEECLTQLERSLSAAGNASHVIAAVHHLPFAELLPPPRIPQWDFAKAYFGSARIGQLLLKYPNVRQVFCGHTHLALEAKIGPVHAINVGSGYHWKTFRTIDL
jgi:predicted phosphodiesterase